MKQLKRRVGSATYTSSGSVSTIELPRNYNYRKLICRINGTVDVAGGAASGSVHARAALRAISRVELIANGRDTILSLPPEAIFVLNQIDYGCIPSLTNPANGDAELNKAFSALFIIDLALMRSVRPIDTLFPAAALSTLDLKITWGAGADMFTGAFDRTATIDTTTEVTVQSFEEIGEIPGNIAVNKIFSIDRVITAASSNFQIQIPVGNYYRGFLLYTNIDNVQADTILDGISVESGTEVYQKWLSNDELLDYNKVQYALETRLVGWHNVDFMDSDGFMTEILDATQISSLDLILNVALPAGTTRRVVVYPQELILPAKR